MHYEKKHQTPNITFPSSKNLIDHKVLFFACVLYMHVLTEFRCKHVLRILWKFSVPAPQLLWWYPEQHLSSSTHYDFLSRDIAFLVWVWRLVGQNTWTETLSWAERYVSISKTSWINLQIKKGSVLQSAFMATDLLRVLETLHWDCLICSSNLFQQMSTHLVWWTALIIRFCFGISEQGGTQD